MVVCTLRINFIYSTLDFINMGLLELVDSMSLFGEALIRDDKGDLGYFDYRNRRRHTYHGKNAPHHPSPFHHYQVGTILSLIAYCLAPIAMAIDIKEELVGDEENYPYVPSTYTTTTSY